MQEILDQCSLDDIKEYINKNKFDTDIESIRKLRLFIINNIQ